MSAINYPVGDFLIRLKNASIAKHKEVNVSNTNLIRMVATLLVKEGYLDEMKEEGKILHVRLSYRRKSPVLSDVVLISKPGLRVYKNADELSQRKGPFLGIVSTSKGVISLREAIKKRLGGELIADIL